MHKFNPMEKSKLDNEWRREVLPPIKVLEALELKQNDVIADIGCGIGYFAIPAAELSNKVYALDISEDMLAEVERRAKIADVNNIITLQNREYDLKLPDAVVSFALMVNMLHEVEDKDRMLTEATRLIKVDGKLAIVEWQKVEMENGPPVDHRISIIEAKRLLSKAGLKITTELDFSGIFYGIVTAKK